jgi:hypothetical protein
VKCFSRDDRNEHLCSTLWHIRHKEAPLEKINGGQSAKLVHNRRVKDARHGSGCALACRFIHQHEAVRLEISSHNVTVRRQSCLACARHGSSALISRPGLAIIIVECAPQPQRTFAAFSTSLLRSLNNPIRRLHSVPGRAARLWQRYCLLGLLKRLTHTRH